MSHHLKPLSFLLALGVGAYASIPILWVAYLLITSNGLINALPISPNAGAKQSVPNDLWTMGDLTNQHRLKTYRVSKELDDLGLYKMRSIEYLYPARYDSQSPALFTAANAQIDPTCKLVETQGNIALYDCQ